MDPSISIKDMYYVRPEIQSSRVMNPKEMTDFEFTSMESQRKKLQYFTDKTNEESKQEQDSKIFINLSLVQLLSHMSSTIIDILNDLTNMEHNIAISEIIYIFVQKDRLIYIGILIVIISLMIYILDITS
jgi:hypothetical protein